MNLCVVICVYDDVVVAIVGALQNLIFVLKFLGGIAKIGVLLG